MILPSVFLFICSIPLQFTFLAADPCAAWEQFQVDFSIAVGRFYWTDTIVEPARAIDFVMPLPVTTYPVRDLADMGPLIVEQVPGETFHGTNGYAVAGSFEWLPFSVPQLKIAVDSPLRPQLHEIQHWIGCRNFGKSSAACKSMQHGTVDDPMRSNLERVRNALYWPLPETHSYRQRVLTSVPTVWETLCATEVE